MKALIVGGGSVGRFIAEQLGASGHSVTILDNDSGPVPVNNPVIADVAPTTLLDMPAADLGDLVGEGVPGHPFWTCVGAVQDDLGDRIAGDALENHGMSFR